ncbi:MAG: hypothetical protein ACOX1N_00725 [Candidatus Methanomethylophilaceae archaeon]|jgi:hypothetical protein
MDLNFGLAALIGIAPAMILMYAVLRKYTYPAVEKPFFSDPYFFGLFVVGMIAGTIIFAVYTYFWGNVVINALLFGILEIMVLLVIMNLKRFHGNSDTVFYGYGLGLGFGATASVGMIFYLTSAASSLEGAVTAYDYAILIAYTVSKTMMLSSAGLTIGEGVARLSILEFTSQAMLMNMIFHLILIPWFMNPETLLGVIGIIGALVLSSAYLYKTAFSDLPEVVRSVLRQQGVRRDDLPK